MTNSLQGVSLTAFYCCGVRAADAELPVSVCGDGYAKHFLTDEARALSARFRDLANPNGSNVTRHRIIDDLLRNRLLQDPARPILILGAGFDTRAFRHRGGRWLEVDDAALIRFKEERLAAGRSPNPLERVGVNLAENWLPEVLQRYRGAGRVTVVLEGVLLYLEPARITTLLETLHRRLPPHEIICDLMTRRFFERYSQELHQRFEALGTSFKFLEHRPEVLFTEAGYRPAEKISIVERATAFGAVDAPPFLVQTVLRTLRNGYRVWVFESES